MKLSRRDLLRLGAWAGMVPMSAYVIACGGDDSDEVGPLDLFQHGVASGDPLADAVVLWTRVTQPEDRSLRVDWEVAEDAEFQRQVSRGAVITDASLDYTVKVDVTGLAAGSTYYYRFRSLQRLSPVGRTRTAPRGAVDRLRLAVASCARLAQGYFHAYRSIAERLDLDAVVHLGDYIYEDGGAGVRAHDPPRELVDIEDYRARYAQYRGDADLQAAHQQHPFIAVWDDHESANNSWRDGASNHDPDDDVDWFDRKAIAQRVYSEWMPIRTESPDRIFRAFSYGELVDLLMLDTRLWGRDQQVDITAEDAAAQMKDPDRSLLGSDQEEWLSTRLLDSTARWKMIGQQVMMGQLTVGGVPNSEGGGIVVNSDQWDGYQETRRRFFDLLRANAIDNVIVLTGDIHSSWAIELTADPNNPDAYDPETGEGSLAVELVTPGVTNLFPIEGVEELLRLQNPHIRYANTVNRGYLVLDVTAERVQAAWFHFDQVEEQSATESFGAAYSVFAGENRLVEDTDPAPPPLSPPAAA